MRHVLRFLDFFTKQFAGHIAAGDQRLAAGTPGVDAALQHADLSIAESLQGLRGAVRTLVAAAAIDHAHRRATIRHQRGDPEFNLPARQEGGAEQMAPMRFAGFAYIEQGVLLTRVEPLTQFWRTDQDHADEYPACLGRGQWEVGLKRCTVRNAKHKKEQKIPRRFAAPRHFLQCVSECERLHSILDTLAAATDHGFVNRRSNTHGRIRTLYRQDPRLLPVPGI